MADEVSLANRALTLCGALRIMDLSDDTKSGRAISAVFNDVRDSCMSIANWRFSLVRETLAATTAQDGYAYAYIIPADWLRFIEVQDRYVGAPMLGPRYIQDPQQEYVIETNRTILCNYAPDLKARGVKRITDVGLWDALFNDYFVESLACAIWEDVSRKGATKLSIRLEERELALRIARANNAIQEAPEEIEDTSWVLSRVGP